MAKSRIQRKALKQPDEFVHLGQQLLSWALDHRTTLLAVSAGVIVLLAALGIAGAYRAANQRRANEVLAQGLAALRSSDWDRAADSFNRVVTEWPRTSAGRIALLLAADAELRAQRPERANDRLRQADGTLSASPYLEQQFLLARSFALEHAGQYGEAASLAERSANLSGPYSATSLYEAARLYIRAGNAEKARDLLQRLKKDHPNAPENQWASALMPERSSH